MMTTLRLTPPAAIAPTHVLTDFDSGKPSLDDWLRRRALKNHAAAPKAMRRNMPDPLPVLLLGRLAIDRRYHNRGLGSALLRDAMLHAVNVAGNAGIFAILVHALHDQARQFYLSRGFVASPLQPTTLMMTLETIRMVLAEDD